MRSFIQRLFKENSHNLELEKAEAQKMSAVGRIAT